MKNGGFSSRPPLEELRDTVSKNGYSFTVGDIIISMKTKLKWGLKEI